MYVNPSTEHRKENMMRLIDLAKSVEIPKDWNLFIAEASLRFENKDRSRAIKINSSCIMMLDVTGVSGTRSNTFTCTDVDDVWHMARQTLKAFIGQS